MAIPSVSEDTPYIAGGRVKWYNNFETQIGNIKTITQKSNIKGNSYL